MTSLNDVIGNHRADGELKKSDMMRLSPLYIYGYYRPPTRRTIDDVCGRDDRNFTTSVGHAVALGPVGITDEHIA